MALKRDRMKSAVQQEFDHLKTLISTDAYKTAFESFCVKYEDDSKAKNEINRLIKEGIDAVGKRLEQLAARIEMQTV